MIELPSHNILSAFHETPLCSVVFKLNANYHDIDTYIAINATVYMLY